MLPAKPTTISLQDKQAQDRSLRRRLVRQEPQFLPLLLSVLLPVLLLPVIAQTGMEYGVVLPLLLTVLVVQSLRALPLLLPHVQRSRVALQVHRFLGVGALLVMWMLPLLRLLGHQSNHFLQFLVLLLSGLFALVACVRLVRLLGLVPRVNAQVMAGAAAGYLYIGITGGLLASALQVAVPGSFSLGVLAGHHELLADRLIYFSFVVLCGLGLGDVLPANTMAERFVMLLSVSGTLYLTLLMGLLIGRFIATSEVDLEIEALEDEEDTLTLAPLDVEQRG
jgi:hypothetical protein